MTDHAIVDALNALADTLNQAAAMFEAVGRLPAVDPLRMRGDRHAVPGIEAHSPMGVLVEQGRRFTAMMPEPAERTIWVPPKA